MQYTVLVDGRVYGFHHSPLGALVTPANIYHMRDDEEEDHGAVAELRRQSETGGASAPWPAHLWWVRLLTTAERKLRDTDLADIAALANTGRWHRHWLQRTTLAERREFFADPVAHLPAVADLLRSDCACGPVAVSEFNEVVNALRAKAPDVLLPCTAAGGLAYTGEYMRASLRELLAEHVACRHFGHHYETVREMYTQYYGGNLDMIVHDPTVADSYRILGHGRRSAEVDRYFVERQCAENWETFAAALRGAVRERGLLVVFLDAPVGVRRRVYRSLATGRTCRYVQCGGAKQPEGTSAPPPPADIVIYDGVRGRHAELVAALTGGTSDQNGTVLILAGDTRDRSREEDLWTLCCRTNAATTRMVGGDTVPSPAPHNGTVTDWMVGAKTNNGGLLVWRQEDDPSDGCPRHLDVIQVDITRPTDFYAALPEVPAVHRIIAGHNDVVFVGMDGAEIADICRRTVRKRKRSKAAVCTVQHTIADRVDRYEYERPVLAFVPYHRLASPSYKAHVAYTLRHTGRRVTVVTNAYNLMAPTVVDDDCEPVQLLVDTLAELALPQANKQKGQTPDALPCQ